MEAGGKDCEEETLQMAFKKLRVDAESACGQVSVSEALTPRTASRCGLDAGGAKAKVSCPKEHWHSCLRRTSRGASRSQRRRRSKSPILHVPKFTYCSTSSASALSPPVGCLKHQRLTLPEPGEPLPAAGRRAAPSLGAPAQTELPSAATPERVPPAVFGSGVGYKTHAESVVSTQEVPNVSLSGRRGRGRCGGMLSSEGGGVKNSCEPGTPQISPHADAADFRALSELSGGAAPGSAEAPPCSCVWSQSPDRQGGECRCRAQRQGWAGMEVYSFTGLRNVISECERSLASHEDPPRTVSSNAAAPSSGSGAAASSSGSPRSCSEQARAFVDDITIEDLSGYMEFYLYIPKKMSHMAEMMYT